LPESTVLTLPEKQKNRKFNIQWKGTDKGSGIKYYDVLFRENGGQWKYAAVQTSSNSVEFTGDHGKMYEFYTVAYDTALNREIIPLLPEAKTFIEEDTSTGISPDYKNEMLIFPNPANQFLHVQLSNPDLPVILKVMDLTGRVYIIEKYTHLPNVTYTLNTENLPTGMYIIQ